MQKNKYLINQQIKTDTVRIINHPENNGVYDFNEAISLAQEEKSDLIQVGKGDYPLCRIATLDKLKYEEKKKEKEQKKKQNHKKPKTLRIGLFIDDNDLERIIKDGISFLNKGHELKLSVQLKRNRDDAQGKQQKERAWDLLEYSIKQIESQIQIISSIKLEGKFVRAYLKPEK